MRKLLLIVFLGSVIFAWAQAPEKINFQTVIHETDGLVLPNKNVKLIVNILSESANGDIVYREEHSVQSNQFGLINLQIGTGEVLYGAWEEILWSVDDQYMMIELDSSGTGSSYVDMGVAQMLSVPYALYADESETSNIWQENEDGIHFNGNIAIGQVDAEQDLHIAADGRIQLSSDMTSLEENALLKLVMDADTAKPTVNWRDINNLYTASLSFEDFTTNPLTSSKRFVLSTADNSNARRGRLEVKYDENIADIYFVDSKVILENEFTSGDLSNSMNNIFWSHNWVNNGYKFGIGEKNWSVSGVYGDAAAEMYTNGMDNYLLLNAAEELDRVQLVFRRGNAEWVCGHDELFYFKRNDAKKMKFMANGNVKIGGSDPEYKLDVYGDVNIPVGYSYLIGGGKSGGKFAEYFQSEETVELGSPVGMNIETGMVRNYQDGDVFVGIACEPTGFVANADYSKNSDYILVGLEGLMEMNSQKNQISNHQVYTTDGKKIGAIIDGKVFLQ